MKNESVKSMRRELLINYFICNIIKLKCAFISGLKKLPNYDQIHRSVSFTEVSNHASLILHFFILLVKHFFKLVMNAILHSFKDNGNVIEHIVMTP